MLHNTYPIDERNALLLNVFSKLGYNVKLVGNKNQPKLVINNEFAISGYVHNKLYHFTTKPFGGEIMKTISLTIDNPITKNEVDTLIHRSEKRQLWKIVVANHEQSTDLFYVKTENLSPYFSTDDCRFFFDEDKVVETVDYLFQTHGVECNIITSE